MLGRGLRKSDELEFDDAEFCLSYDKYTGEDVSMAMNSTGDKKALANAISLKQDSTKKTTGTSKAKVNSFSSSKKN